MRCPICDGDKSRIKSGTDDEDSFIRTRECLDCGHSWRTIEIDVDMYYSNVKHKVQKKRGRPKK